MNRHLKFCFLSILFFGFSACQQNEDSPSNQVFSGKLFEQISAEQSGVDFVNHNRETLEAHLGHYDYFYNGSGVGVADFDNDGLMDLYFASNQGSNKLYKNKGNLKFEDRTEGCGAQSTDRWSNGVSVIDINQDGLMDIYVCNSGHGNLGSYENQLFINQGNFKFKDEAKQYGLNSNAYSSQAVFFDYDQDNDLDVYIANHSNILRDKVSVFLEKVSAMPAEESRRHGGQLYSNNGNNTFTEVTTEAGLSKPGFGLGVIAADINQDNKIDLYVANDYFIPDFYFLNMGGGKFSDVTRQRLGHSSYFSMGIDAADINNDGLLDLGVVDMTSSDHIRSKTLMPSMDPIGFDYLTKTKGYTKQFMQNAFQLNMGNGYYADIAMANGTAKTEWSWSPLIADFDNDGYKDYFVSNGFKRDTKNNDWLMQIAEFEKKKNGKLSNQEYLEFLNKAPAQELQNFAFKNDKNLGFVATADEWGLTEKTFSNGAIYSDLDNDGDLDLIINNIDKPASIHENKLNGSSSYLQVSLTDPSHKDARIHNSKMSLILENGAQQFVELSNVRGYYSSGQAIAHFGLNENSEIKYLEITLSDGSSAIVRNLKLNQLNNISIPTLSWVQKSKPKSKPLMMNLGKQVFASPISHTENDHNDFATEILLPHKQSTLGPFIDVGDVNGDQLDDFFIGNAKGAAGQLMIQTPDGRFRSAQQTLWATDKDYEDMGVAFLDIDNDKDLDLYVASGGGSDIMRKDGFKNRIYINDGKGNFSKSKNDNSAGLISNGRIIKEDFDQDGDLDLLLTGRTNPGNYPHPTPTILLENIGGQFKNVSDNKLKGIESIAMTTDACFSDIDGDGDRDLLIVGEWSKINVFQNENNSFKLSEKDYGFGQLKGWWYSIASEDMDGDGDMDLIVGNLGINNKFHPTPEKPLILFADDFDDNGSNDIVLSKKYKGEFVPVRGRECSSEQMPFIKEKFPNFQGFAEASIQDILGESELDASLRLEVNTFESYYLENQGNQFEVSALPKEAQLFPIQSILISDYNRDGIKDILVAGNIFNTEVETPSYDAGKGLILKGNGKGDFEALNSKTSGITMQMNVKDLKSIKLSRQQIPGVLVGNNDEKLQLYALIPKQK